MSRDDVDPVKQLIKLTFLFIAIHIGLAVISFALFKVLISQFIDDLSSDEMQIFVGFVMLLFGIGVCCLSCCCGCVMFSYCKLKGSYEKVESSRGMVLQIYGQ